LFANDDEKKNHFIHLFIVVLIIVLLEDIKQMVSVVGLLFVGKYAAHAHFVETVHQGGSVSKVVCGPALREIAIETAKLCHLDIAGVDLMMAQKTYVVCEVCQRKSLSALRFVVVFQNNHYCRSILLLDLKVWNMQQRLILQQR
jgi:hypothetical protein